MKIRIVLTILASALIAGCGTMNAAVNGSTQVVEYYRVFDVKTDATRDAVIASARDGLARNTSNISDYRPIVPPGPLPETPGRFTTVDSMPNIAGAGLAALAGAQGNMLKRAKCDGAIWIGNATRGGNTAVRDSNATLSVCVWQYAGGYHVDLYANLSMQKGGFGIDAAARSIAHGIVGTPEEWIETTLNDVPRQVIKETGGSLTLVDGYPQPQGTPWLCRSGDQC